MDARTRWALGVILTVLAIAVIIAALAGSAHDSSPPLVKRDALERGQQPDASRNSIRPRLAASMPLHCSTRCNREGMLRAHIPYRLATPLCLPP
jgi:hypothetical protein